MIRVLLIFAAFIGLAGLAGAIANLPGQASFALGDRIIEIDTALLVGLFFLASLALFMLAALGQFIWHMPAQFAAKKQARLRDEGEIAMAAALMALARGDATAADKATQQAREKLPQQALPRLMSAQAALLQGCPDDAAADYHAMLAAGTSLAQKTLGLEGLYYMAVANHDTQAAGTYALQVLELAPKTLWALDGMMTLAVHIADWQAAEDWLRRWSRAGVKRQLVKRRRAVLLLAEAQHILAADDPSERAMAQKKAAQAAALDKDFIAATALAAELTAASGQLPKARKQLKQAFARTPHAALAEAWLRCHAGQSLAGKQRAVSGFIGPHKEHEEALILRARIALDGERWRLAKSLLLPLAEAETASRDLCSLMAAAETGLKEPAEAQYWHDRARRAPGAAGWMANGVRLDGWQAICPVTGRLDAVAWQSPQATLPALLAVSGSASSASSSGPPSATARLA
ncbi:MAG: heme biosynthesis HemY N-terminal domain-containing protein [Parvibaculales bacterium]